MKIRGSMLMGAALTVSGCAINPQTGQPEIAPAVKTQFNSVFDSPDPCANNDRNIGIVAGAVAGGVVGYLVHGTKGAIAGAVIGSGGGFLIGHVLDSRRCALYKIAQANGLRLASAPITQGKPAGSSGSGNDAGNALGLDVQLENKSDEFVAGTAELTPQARGYLAQIAAQYAPKTALAALPSNATPEQRAQALNRKVLIVGHTDEGDASLGADPSTLSQQRAKAVAKVFMDQGVPMQNIFYQGAGDTLPIASNATQQGREENQRVQIVDVPTEADLQQFLSQRTANPANYLFANTATQAGAPSNSGDLAAQSNQETAATKAADQDRPTQPAATPKPVRKARANPVEKTTSSNSDPAADSTMANPATNSTQKTPLASPPSLAADRNAASGYDFGGAPTTGAGVPVRLGAPLSKSAFSIISNANASPQMTLGSCLGDRPHNASAVRNLATDQVLNVRDYMPGFYGAPWVAGMGGNLVALLNVRVPSDAGSPVPEPELNIYKAYASNPKQKPSFTARVPVNVYRGRDATLYRVFVQGPMRCMDLVVPTSQPRATGNVYYTNRAVDFTASGVFALR
ncbi:MULTISPECIES: OmpA family protein [Paraburkholderia]|uniref:OmpA family protein n=1 Tax=Paraburkholderia madseniana TaxID=2599607 RepID=A0AAP5ER37_9BURK|nr:MULTISPECIES: OmpA family protein [Paraburkholderia]MCX4149503.1 OmpA family protein [Paraburkholderia madseniana]MDN7152439.1 OmpA family protein [Paraburkholderia sp. WS6]MDQ6411321.1 OmpA family protein [Paraburkholderia madseniana]